MRILYMGNNWLGWQILRWLKQRNETVVGLVIHPPSKQQFGEEILEAADLPASRIFETTGLRSEETLEKIRKLKPDLGLSILPDVILKPPFFSMFPQGVINLHPAYLPYNRGQYPNVWSIIEGTPAGTTIHYIDKGIDTGEIIAQRAVEVEPIDTGESLYRKLERTSLDLFVETWPEIATGKASRVSQPQDEGTYHRRGDVEAVDAIDLDATYRAGDLIDILRARSFPPYKGAFFESGGKRIYVRIQLEYGEES